GGSLTSLPHNRLTLATRADENLFWSESPTGPPVFTISGFALALHLLRIRAVVASRNLVEMTELRSDDRLFHLTLCPNKLSEPGWSSIIARSSGWAASLDPRSAIRRQGRRPLPGEAQARRHSPMPARVLLAEGTKPDTRVGDEPCQFGDRRAAVGLQQIAWLGPIISGWIIANRGRFQRCCRNDRVGLHRQPRSCCVSPGDKRQAAAGVVVAVRAPAIGFQRRRLSPTEWRELARQTQICHSCIEHQSYADHKSIGCLSARWLRLLGGAANAGRDR